MERIPLFWNPPAEAVRIQRREERETNCVPLTKDTSLIHKHLSGNAHCLSGILKQDLIF